MLFVRFSGKYANMAKRPPMSWLQSVVIGLILIIVGFVYLHGNDFGQNLSPSGRVYYGVTSVVCGALVMVIGFVIMSLRKKRHG